MKVRLRVIVLAVPSLGALLACAPSGDSKLQEGQGKNAVAAPGMSVHLDEEGKPIVPEPGRRPAMADVGGGGGASEEDVAIQPAPGGGEMVVLDERFDHRSALHVGSGGEVSMDCRRGAPSGASPRERRGRSVSPGVWAQMKAE